MEAIQAWWYGPGNRSFSRWRVQSRNTVPFWLAPGAHRPYLLSILDDALKQGAQYQRDRKNGQLSLWGAR